MSVIDTSTHTVAHTVEVGSAARAVAITPIGNDAYVADFGSDKVSVIDTSTYRVVKTVRVGREPDGVAIT